jgi:hypothetical protein
VGSWPGLLLPWSDETTYKRVVYMDFYNGMNGNINQSINNKGNIVVSPSINYLITVFLIKIVVLYRKIKDMVFCGNYGRNLGR